MAYIRTFDGEIYDVGSNASIMEDYPMEGHPNIVCLDSNGQHMVKLFSRMSDTPEELCDEFIIQSLMPGIDKVSDKDRIIYNHLVYSYDNWEHYVYCGDSDEIEVPYDGQPLKGAIWTDKGLKYVIERTKDGKWELLDSIQST